MNPILAFYKKKDHEKITGEFPCEECAGVTYNAVYQITEKNTYWVCKWCETENSIENQEMEYEREE